MDLSPRLIIRSKEIIRGPLLGRGAFGFVFRAQYARDLSSAASGNGNRRGDTRSATVAPRDVAMKMLQPVQPGPRARQSAIIAYKVIYKRHNNHHIFCN